MRCEDINQQLVEFAEATVSETAHNTIEAHLERCSTCQADYAAISDWRSMASNWHDEVPPAWEIPKLENDYFAQFTDGFRQWFPMFASTAALVLVTVMFIQQPVTNGSLPMQQTAANYDDLPPLPKATQAAMVQSVLESSRTERGEELQALLKILKGEMDKRSIETEKSLRYIITHQVQGQQELDDLYQQVETMMKEEQASLAAGSGTGSPTAINANDAPADESGKLEATP